MSLSRQISSNHQCQWRDFCKWLFKSSDQQQNSKYCLKLTWICHKFPSVFVSNLKMYFSRIAKMYLSQIAKFEFVSYWKIYLSQIVKYWQKVLVLYCPILSFMVWMQKIDFDMVKYQNIYQRPMLSGPLRERNWGDLWGGRTR